MKVRCVKILPTLPIARRLGRHYTPGQEFPLTAGAEYPVFGLRFWAGAPWIDIEAVPGYLVIVPLGLFEVIDGRVPENWVAAVDDQGDVSLLPEAFHDKFFIDDLFEGKEDAVRAFQNAREQMLDRPTGREPQPE